VNFVHKKTPRGTLPVNSNPLATALYIKDSCGIVTIYI
jgi:hypothetical protein